MIRAIPLAALAVFELSVPAYALQAENLQMTKPKSYAVGSTPGRPSRS